MGKSLSIVLENKGLVLDISYHEEAQKYDVLLSILLGKIIVIYVKMKYRLSNINNQEYTGDIELKERIFDAINCHSLVQDIIDHFKGDILIEISNETFNEFLPFIKCSNGDNSDSDESKNSMLSFVELLFPILTSKSQISIIETYLADIFLSIETEKFKNFLLFINSPFFTLMFLK